MTLKTIIYNEEDNAYVFECPHCNIMIQVKRNELACKIFRHGYFKSTMTGIDPHTPQIECDRLRHQDLIWGCGKPFCIVLERNTAEICDYI